MTHQFGGVVSVVSTAVSNPAPMLGASFNGRTQVSKTCNGGSIPSAPAIGAGQVLAPLPGVYL